MFKKMNLVSKANMKVLEFLAANPESKFYGREIAKKTGISVGAINGALNSLFKEGLLDKEKRGALHFYSVNMKSPVMRQFKVLLNVINVNGLVDEISEFSEKAMLFGSCANGTNRGNSDIDIFIVTREKGKIAELVRKHQSAIGTKIQSLVLEPRDIARFKRDNIHLYDQINNGILLWDTNG
jgi:predicted nucleotidyltransferase